MNERADEPKRLEAMVVGIYSADVCEDRLTYMAYFDLSDGGIACQSWTPGKPLSNLVRVE